MDPEACLTRAEDALGSCETDAFEALAFEALIDYFDWRDHGGFEPKNGDARANALALALVGYLECRMRAA